MVIEKRAKFWVKFMIYVLTRDFSSIKVNVNLYLLY